jgi:hypothetical protein
MSDNQTRDEWLELPAVATNSHAQGTGIILKSSGAGKEFIKDVEYRALIDAAVSGNYYAFAWVPHAVASFQYLNGVSCTHLRCMGKCPPGCICDRDQGHCV